MIYNTKNMNSFMGNYMSADGSGDKRMKRDILISEIAKIIVNRPNKVMGHLKLYGFAVSQNASKKELATVVSRALLKSPRFAAQMAIEILGGTYGAAGSMDTATTEVVGPTSTAIPTSPDPTAATTVSTAPIVNGLGEVFGGTSTVASPTPTPTPSGPATSVSTTTASGSKTITASPITQEPGGDGKTLFQRIVVTNDGGGSGGGGGSYGPVNEQATEDLKNKVETLSGDTGMSVKKKIAFALLIATVIGGGIYIYKS